MIAKHVIEFIAAKVAEAGGWDGKSLDEVLALCNAPTAENAVKSAPQVPRVMAESELLALLSVASLSALVVWPSLGLVKQAITDQDHAAIPLWANLLRTVGIIKTDAERDAIAAYATTPVDDPDWSPNVSEARAALGRDVTPEDVIAAKAPE